MSDEIVILTTKQAITMLPEGDTVHTFRQVGMMIVGADLPKENVVSAIEKYGCELAGEQATAMGHGMVLKDDVGHLFIATRGEGN